MKHYQSVSSFYSGRARLVDGTNGPLSLQLTTRLLSIIRKFRACSASTSYRPNVRYGLASSLQLCYCTTLLIAVPKRNGLRSSYGCVNRRA